MVAQAAPENSPAPEERHRRHSSLRDAQEAEVMQALREYAARAARVREELGEEVADPGEAARLADRIEAALASSSEMERTRDDRTRSLL
jgi:hypothetical protein